MGSIVPEYLRKAELIFEVVSRGESPAGDVRALRAQFRGLVGAEQAWRPAFDVGAELESCQVRFEELSGELEGLVLPLVGTARTSLTTQLLHWRTRLSLLCQSLDLSPSDKEWAEAGVAEFDSALEQLSQGRSVKQTVDLFESGARGSTSNGEADLGNSHTPSAGVPTSSLVAAPPAQFPPMTTVSPPAQSLPTLSFSSATQATYPVASRVSEPVGGGCRLSFARLPHPLNSLLASVTPTDGLHLETLLNFLERALKMKEFPGMSDVALMELLVPYCLQPLVNILMGCLHRQVSFDGFHAEVLALFVPDRVMDRLKVERIYRAQLHTEPINFFISDIRAVARVLRLNFTEAQLVETILQGLTPDERSRLFSAPRPSSFSDLDRLCILSRSVQDTDLQRGPPVGHLPPPPQLPVVASVGQTPEASLQQRPAPVCFGCGQPGHYRRNCRQRAPRHFGPKN